MISPGTAEGVGIVKSAARTLPMGLWVIALG